MSIKTPEILGRTRQVLVGENETLVRCLIYDEVVILTESGSKVVFHRLDRLIRVIDAESGDEDEYRQESLK